MSLDFCHENPVLDSNAIGQHRLGPHSFKSQTPNPYACKAPKANAKIMFLLPIFEN